MLTYLLWAGCSLLFFSCSEDEGDPYPPVKLEFLTALSDGEGRIIKLITDSGEELEVIEDRTLSSIKANSSERFVCYYEPLREEGNKFSQARVYTLLSPITAQPLPAEEFSTGIKTDPLDVVSIWLSGGYINMVLSVKMQNGYHTLHFIEEEVITLRPGAKESMYVALRLYHDANNDPESFTRRAYACIPLDKYATSGGTSISFTVNTTKEGEKTYSFKYLPPTD